MFLFFQGFGIEQNRPHWRRNVFVVYPTGRFVRTRWYNIIIVLLSSTSMMFELSKIVNYYNPFTETWAKTYSNNYPPKAWRDCCTWRRLTTRTWGNSRHPNTFPGFNLWCYRMHTTAARFCPSSPKTIRRHLPRRVSTSPSYFQPTKTISTWLSGIPACPTYGPNCVSIDIPVFARSNIPRTIEPERKCDWKIK